MKIHNVHERVIPKTNAGDLIDRLSSPHDCFWPAAWPAMRLDRPLGVGAKGGHGPVRYHVEEYEPGKRVRFAFDPGPLTNGFEGMHELELIPDDLGVRLRHRIDMRASIAAALRWYLVIEPLHDALLEDAFDRAEGVKRSRWSWRVRLLRQALGRKTANADV